MTMVSPDEVQAALEEAGLTGALLLHLHVREIRVTDARGRPYAIRFLPNGTAAVSLLDDVKRRDICETAAAVLAAIHRWPSP
ncbi:MAG TPA: hypothetical protein VGG39_11855 [Polyangiaceae bacterium]|jgi:hypothetical protein